MLGSQGTACAWERGLAKKPAMKKIAGFNNQRVHGQKGVFLLFGMSMDNHQTTIKLISDNGSELDPKLHPIAKITKITLNHRIKQRELEKLGI